MATIRRKFERGSHGKHVLNFSKNEIPTDVQCVFLDENPCLDLCCCFVVMNFHSESREIQNIRHFFNLACFPILTDEGKKDWIEKKIIHPWFLHVPTVEGCRADHLETLEFSLIREDLPNCGFADDHAEFYAIVHTKKSVDPEFPRPPYFWVASHALFPHAVSFFQSGFSRHSQENVFVPKALNNAGPNEDRKMRFLFKGFMFQFNKVPQNKKIAGKIGVYELDSEKIVFEVPFEETLESEWLFFVDLTRENKFICEKFDYETHRVFVRLIPEEQDFFCIEAWVWGSKLAPYCLK